MTIEMSDCAAGWIRTRPLTPREMNEIAGDSIRMGFGRFRGDLPNDGYIQPLQAFFSYLARRTTLPCLAACHDRPQPRLAARQRWTAFQ